MNLPERNEKIFNMRETGATYREIAEAFNINGCKQGIED